VQLSAMRDHVRNVVDITSNDITDATMNTFIREGYDIIVYSEKRWPFYEVALTFDTVASQKDYTMAEVGTALSFTHDGVTFSGASAPKNVGVREDRPEFHSRRCDLLWGISPKECRGA